MGFWILDLDGRILEVNDAYCAMSGYNRDELIGRTIEHIDVSLDREKLDTERNLVLKKGALQHETSHIRKDGTLFDVAVNTKLIKEEGVIFSFAQDITELKKARMELEERLTFERLISEFSAALINVRLNDYKKEIRLWLGRFAKLLQVDRFTIIEYHENFNSLNLLFSYTNPDIRHKALPRHSKPVETY